MEIGIWLNENYVPQSDGYFPPQIIQFTVLKITPKTVEGALIQYENERFKRRSKHKIRWKKEDVEFFISYYGLEYKGAITAHG